MLTSIWSLFPQMCHLSTQSHTVTCVLLSCHCNFSLAELHPNASLAGERGC